MCRYRYKYRATARRLEDESRRGEGEGKGTPNGCSTLKSQGLEHKCFNSYNIYAYHIYIFYIYSMTVRSNSLRLRVIIHIAAQRSCTWTKKKKNGSDEFHLKCSG